MFQELASPLSTAAKWHSRFIALKPLRIDRRRLMGREMSGAGSCPQHILAQQ
jgi:hypothetical protein